jgi:hypothetical protein
MCDMLQDYNVIRIMSLFRTLCLPSRAMHSKAKLMDLPVQKQIRILPELKIELTERESQLCGLLRKFTAHLKETGQPSPTCRIAGGWVRDKVGLQVHLLTDTIMVGSCSVYRVTTLISH